MSSNLENQSNEDDPSMPRPMSGTVGGGIRKKGTTVKEWIQINDVGKTQMVEAGKYAIMRRTGLHARDLRVLDPILSYASAIMGRERAMVINLEQIKAIITANEVLILNSRDPSVSCFVKELQRRIARRSREAFSSSQEGNGDDLAEPQPWDQVEDEEDNARNQDGIHILPFEFIALEACLEAACTELENEAKTLEKEAHPALDKLTSNISTLNLERVRQIKSQLVAITGRVQKIRDELEHLLDDDEDMAEMYLTDKFVQRQLESSSTMSTNEGDDSDDEDIQLDMDYRTAHDVSLNTGGDSPSYEDQQNDDKSRDQILGATKHLEVQELEMLLEPYFVQIDGTLNELSTLREYVDDTEDYINIMLDDKQNQLLQMGVMLSTTTFVLTAFIVVAGVMGINIHIDLWVQTPSSMKKFLWTIGGCAAGSILLFVSAFAWYKHKRLL